MTLATKRTSMLAPCPKCPFRVDVKPYITAARAKEITRSVNSGLSFHCHATVEHGDDGEHVPTSKELMCAGAVILARKEGTLYQNQMARIAERLGANFDDVKETAPVYENAAEMVAAHRARSKQEGVASVPASREAGSHISLPLSTEGR